MGTSAEAGGDTCRECENPLAGRDTDNQLREERGAQCEMIMENTQNKSHTPAAVTDTVVRRVLCTDLGFLENGTTQT